MQVTVRLTMAKDRAKEKFKILVVDDEPIIRLDIVTMLKNAGYDVVGSGSDGLDAIELCKKLQPDVILLDIRMENIDGLTAAKEISQRWPDIAIVMLTAFSEGEYIEKAKECNITSYLLKPVNEALLIPNIELAVARNREKNQYEKQVAKANEKLAERKLVEKAKGLLMKNRKLDESASFAYIRDLSKKRSMSMSAVAALIIKQYEER